MCVHSNYAESSSLLCSDPSVGQQVISKVLDELKVVYSAVGSTPWVCICIVCIQCAHC